ncbi:glycosyltransferase 87 family protein [Agromyces sp. ZXT2-6]|uniref:glycosyltransferase 87 family protein n=1 Tax=Agromyces sp. ZXT2-6 TaxID=3461153 RepID=UPI004054D90C
MTTAPAGIAIERDGDGGAIRGARRVAVDVLFWLALAGIVAANLAVLIPGIATVRLWEDEAFNLTVPINLVNGLGYTSDGTLSGSELSPFDVRISTGPVMLLPIAGLVALGIDPVMAGRAVATVGYTGLLAALALIGHRLGGRWAALVAVALPLGFDAAAMPSPIQTPADILGEVTAAAFLAAALLFLRRRPWLAGLLLGLAIQVKFIALLAAPAFALAVLLDAPLPWRERWRRGIPRVLVAAGAAAVPTIVFELAKLASLGPAGYWQHLRDFAWFLRSGGQRGYAVSPIDKLVVLADSWNLPTLVAAAVGVIAVVAGTALVVVAIRRMPRGDARAEFSAVVLAAAVAFATYLAWWLVSRHTPAWVRHPAPAVLAFAPVLAASLVPAARSLLARGDRAEPAARAARTWRWVAVAASVVAAVVLAWSIAGRVTGVGTESRPTGETLASQRAAADDIAELGYDRFAMLWGPGVSVGVLSGAHVGLTDARDVTADDPRIWFGEPPPRCDVELQSGLYSVCIPE